MFVKKVFYLHIASVYCLIVISIIAHFSKNATQNMHYSKNKLCPKMHFLVDILSKICYNKLRSRCLMVHICPNQVDPTRYSRKKDGAKPPFLVDFSPERSYYNNTTGARDPTQNPGQEQDSSRAEKLRYSKAGPNSDLSSRPLTS